MPPKSISYNLELGIVQNSVLESKQASRNLKELSSSPMNHLILIKYLIIVFPKRLSGGKSKLDVVDMSYI